MMNSEQAIVSASIADDPEISIGAEIGNSVIGGLISMELIGGVAARPRQYAEHLVIETIRLAHEAPDREED